MGTWDNQILYDSLCGCPGFDPLQEYFFCLRGGFFELLAAPQEMRKGNGMSGEVQLKGQLFTSALLRDELR
jgi:hypothetical protein